MAGTWEMVGPEGVVVVLIERCMRGIRGLEVGPGGEVLGKQDQP